MANSHLAFLKSVSIISMVIAAGAFSTGLFFLLNTQPEDPLQPQPEDSLQLQPEDTLQPQPEEPSPANPFIYQFTGPFFFKDVSGDSIRQAVIDGTPRTTNFATSLQYDRRNFTPSSCVSTYLLNQTTIGWHDPLYEIPITQNVNYLTITVNSSELCDIAIVSEETITNENVTMRRINCVERSTACFGDSGGISRSSHGTPHFTRVGDEIIIGNSYADWAPFTPHSIYKDLNVTYNYRMEFFHEVAGKPELLVSVEIPTLTLRIWDDPAREDGGIDRDLTITTYCSYYSILDTSHNYPSWFYWTNPFNYNLTAEFTYHYP